MVSWRPMKKTSNDSGSSVHRMGLECLGSMCLKPESTDQVQLLCFAQSLPPPNCGDHSGRRLVPDIRPVVGKDRAYVRYPPGIGGDTVSLITAMNGNDIVGGLTRLDPLGQWR